MDGWPYASYRAGDGCLGARRPPGREGRAMAGLRLDLAEALAGAADGALVIGPDGRILTWNRAAAQILGYRANETVGRQCCEILAGQDVGGGRICSPGCP